MRPRPSARAALWARAAADALRDVHAVQARKQAEAGDQWQDAGLVFTTQLGAARDADDICKMFKRVCRVAGVGDGDGWTPASSAPPSSA